VEQYVHSVLLLLKREKGLDLEKSPIGIDGVGHVGSRVKRMAEGLGMKVLLNDPPRAERGESGFVDLETIARECDVITFHTPLSRDGKYATFHLVNDEFLLSLKRTPYIVNSSRGEVVDTDALLAALATGKVRDVVIDTWENEPDINQELLDAAFLATPHIAGYSADGKANATRMSLEALCRFFHIESAFDIIPDKVDIHFSTDKEEAFLQAYNPKRDSEWLKESPQKFEWFRGNYPIRREI
jgi:erythronate-4-phosphate dehydrogenase